MSFSSFFSNQAREPKGLFGHLIMPGFFDIGNKKLNELVYELISIQENDCVLEIGFGTGKLIANLANQIEQGEIVGVDFSRAMVTTAEKRNSTHINKGKVSLQHDNFDDIPLQKDYYDTVFSVNTIYFWEKPEYTAKKIAQILKPGGKIVIGFESGEKLKGKKSGSDVFQMYSPEEIKELFLGAGFQKGIDIQSRQSGSSEFSCVVGKK